MSKLISQLVYHFRTLYLFTANDFATFAIPTTLFATFASLSGRPLITNSTPSLMATIARMPLALSVIWTNLLLFNISNQHSPAAIEEDRINKPHRPLPSGRLTPKDARQLLLYIAPIAMGIGWAAEVQEETQLLIAFTWMYNDLGGSDEHWVLRNALIALGYGLFSSAALRIMAGPSHKLTPTGFHWICLITVVMFVTQHICDIKDAEGDKLRGRKSAPIVLGDECVRWSVAVPILFCSVWCAWFLELGLRSHMSILAMGGLVAFRILVYRDLKSDKLTWKLWALWTCGLFALPLLNNPEVFVRAWSEAKIFIWEVRCMLCTGNECSTALNLAAVSGVASLIEGKRVIGRLIDKPVNGTIEAGEVFIEDSIR